MGLGWRAGYLTLGTWDSLPPRSLSDGLEWINEGWGWLWSWMDLLGFIRGKKGERRVCFIFIFILVWCVRRMLARVNGFAFRFFLVCLDFFSSGGSPFR